MEIEITSLWGLLILIADIWAVIHIVKSNSTDGKKLLWILLIILLPFIGLIIWAIAGPKKQLIT